MTGADSPRRVSREALIIGLGYLTSFVYPLVSLPYLTRVLGVPQLGVVMVLLAVLQVVVHVTDFGFSISSLRRASLARSVGRRSRVLSETSWAKTLIWTACAAPLISVSVVVPVLHGHLGAMMLGLALILVGAWFPGWMLQATGRMLTFALVMMLSRLVALAGLLLTVRDPAQLDLAVAWQLAPQALASVVSWVLIVHVWRMARLVRVTRRDVSAALRDSAPLFVSNVSTVATGAASALALGAFSSPTQVAFFGAAERFGNAVRGVMRGVVDAMLPRMAAVPDSTMRRFISLGVLGCYGLAGSVLMLGAGWVIPRYLGAEMTGAVWPTRLVGAAILAAGVSAVLTLHANAEHRYGTVARVTAIGAISTVVLGIPAALWSGAFGVGLALLVAESVQAALFLEDRRRRRLAHTPSSAPLSPRSQETRA